MILHFFVPLYGQSVVIAESESTADASAILDVQSESKGLLIPRMTATDRLDISSPADGLLVYQTDDVTGFYYYNGSTWTAFININQITDFGSGQVISDAERTSLNSALQAESDPVFVAHPANAISNAGSGNIITNEERDTLRLAYSNLRMALLRDEKPVGTPGGTAVVNEYVQRVLNTRIGGEDFVSLNSNQFTLQPGTYFISAKAPFYSQGTNIIKLVNVTANPEEDVIIGQTSLGSGTSSFTAFGFAFLEACVEIDVATTYELHHLTTQVVSANQALGVSNQAGGPSVFTEIKIIKAR